MKRGFLIAVAVLLVVAVLLLRFNVGGEELGIILMLFIGFVLLIGRSWLEDLLFRVHKDGDDEDQVADENQRQ